MLCLLLLCHLVTQSCIYTHSFSHTIFRRVLSQEIGYNTVGPHGLAILNVIVGIPSPQTPRLLHSFPPSLLATTGLFALTHYFSIVKNTFLLYVFQDRHVEWEVLLSL